MSRVGGSLIVIGDITSDEDLTIEGRVRGSVLVRNAAVTIGNGADIDGDVRGTRVHISGQVRGGITASERIELTATATVTGSLSADHVVIIDGARFNGSIDMSRRTIAARLAQYKEKEGAAPAAV